jgi:hypothetical protein
MQRSHSGNETYHLPLLAKKEQIVLQFNNRVNYFHLNHLVFKSGCKVTTFLRIMQKLLLKIANICPHLPKLNKKVEEIGLFFVPLHIFF